MNFFRAKSELGGGFDPNKNYAASEKRLLISSSPIFRVNIRLKVPTWRIIPGLVSG